MLSSSEEGYKTAKPNAVNLTTIVAAARKLVPEFDVRKHIIYEKKDIPTEVYAGPSSGLAYLLALISGFRTVKWDTLHDIWGTGSIGFSHDRTPILEAIDEFDTKLGEFLSEKNTDRLFIVPEANIYSDHVTLCQEKDANLIPITEFQNFSAQVSSERKTVVMVCEDDLKTLVDCIFEVPTNFETSSNEVHDNDLSVRTWQYQTGSKIGRVAIDTDGTTIVAGTFEGKVFCLNAEGDLKWQKDVGKECWCVAISPDGQTIIAGTANNISQGNDKFSLFCFDQEGTQRWHDTSKSSVWALAFSTDGQTVAAGMSDELVLFDIEGKRMSLKNNRGIVWLLNADTWDVAVSANGHKIAAVTGASKHAWIFKRNGALIKEFSTEGGTYTVAMSANGESVVVGDLKGYAYWVNQQGSFLWKDQIADKIQALILSNDGQQLWVGTGDKDKHVRVYDSLGRLLWRYYVGGEVKSLALSAKNNRAVVGTKEGEIYIFSIDGIVLRQIFVGHEVRSVALSATGEKIVAGLADGTVYGIHLQ